MQSQQETDTPRSNSDDSNDHEYTRTIRIVDCRQTVPAPGEQESRPSDIIFAVGILGILLSLAASLVMTGVI